MWLAWGSRRRCQKYAGGDFARMRISLGLDESCRLGLGKAAKTFRALKERQIAWSLGKMGATGCFEG